MFPDPFLPRVAVTVGKGSGYARLVVGIVFIIICSNWVRSGNKGWGGGGGVGM